jgi:hypothetical protein
MAALAQTAPLDDSNVLQLVCSYLPPSYLFLGSVCRLWRNARVDSKYTKQTSWRLAVHSAQRFEFACKGGGLFELFELRRWPGNMSYTEHKLSKQAIGCALGKWGSKKMIRWAVRRAYSKSHDILECIHVGAASNGRVDLLEWMFGHYWAKYGLSMEAMVRVAGAASTVPVFKCVWKWAWRHHLSFAHVRCMCSNKGDSSSGARRDCLLNAFALAAYRAGQSEALVWMLDKGIAYNSWVDSAARAENIPLLQCMIEQKSFPAEYYTYSDLRCFEGAVYNALEAHSLRTVEWLLDHGFTMEGGDMLMLALSFSG